MFGTLIVYGVYTSKVSDNRYYTLCSNVSDFNNRNQCLIAKLLKQGYHTIVKHVLNSTTDAQS